MPRFFKNLPIRSKLMLGYTLIFIIATLAGGAAVYFRVKATIEANIESELKNTTETILNMVETAAATSIKNHLRAVAENNRQIVAGIHEAYAARGLDLNQAQAAAADILLSQTIGKTGYAYVLDSQGNLIVHPSLTGNYMDARGGDGHHFIRDICRLKNGTLVYSWKNPDEKAFRKKIVFFNHIPEFDWIVVCSSYHHVHPGSLFPLLPEFDWIVVCSSYLDEIYAPLSAIRTILLLTVGLILVLVFITSLWITGSVIHPLNRLMNRFSLGASGDLSVRMTVDSRDEIGKLAQYFNRFMETLEVYHNDLNTRIETQRRTQKALRLSEEMFSKAFRCSPSGMFIASLSSGEVMNVNESFLALSGYERPEIVDLLGEPCILAAVEDLTESRRLEQEILDISERERQKIAMNLHDDLGPQLMGIEVMTKILMEKLAGKSLKEHHDAGRIQHLILDAIAKTRQLSRGLSPITFSGRDLSTALEEQAAHLYYIAHEAVHGNGP